MMLSNLDYCQVTVNYYLGKPLRKINKNRRHLILSAKPFNAHLISLSVRGIEPQTTTCWALKGQVLITLFFNKIFHVKNNFAKLVKDALAIPPETRFLRFHNTHSPKTISNPSWLKRMWCWKTITCISLPDNFSKRKSSHLNFFNNLVIALRKTCVNCPKR